MRYIFLDESGELGFSKASSKYFVITLLSCDEPTSVSLSRIIKKVRLRKLKKKWKNMPELKGYSSSDSIRKTVLKKAAQEKIEIFTIVLDKEKVYNYLKGNKTVLYNYTAQLILAECSLEGNIKLIVDRSYKKFLIGEFDRYIKEKVLRVNKECRLEIQHVDSKNDARLQILDFISWAIFRKYESKDETFYNIIKCRIVTEKLMFEKYPDPRG